MAYTLKEVTIRTNNTPEGLKRIEALWEDIATGKLPIIFDSEHNFHMGISPISMYSNYESNEDGDYDLSILGVNSDFFSKLESEVRNGKYKKYVSTGENMTSSIKNAWKTVWKEQQKGIISRSYITDYESAVPAEYTKDGMAHCYLWISLT